MEVPQQAELLAAPEEAARPIAVQNGRMLATYLGLGLERDKNNEKLVHLDFAFPLEEAHDGFIPRKVKDAWTWLKEQDNKAVQIKGIPAITLDVFLDPKRRSPNFISPAQNSSKRSCKCGGSRQRKSHDGYAIRFPSARRTDKAGYRLGGVA